MNTETNTAGNSNTAVPAPAELDHSYTAFKAYVAAIGDTYKPEIGERLVKLQFKAAVSGANKGKTAAPNSYISVPDHITPQAVEEKLPELMPVIIGYLQEHEAGMLRKELIAGVTQLSRSSFSLDKIIASLQDSGAGRLNKEQIEAWFTNEVADKLTGALAAKMGFTEIEAITEAELEKLSLMSEAYKQKFVALSSPKTSYMPAEAEMLVKCMELTKVADAGIGARLAPRLSKMVQATPDSLLMSL